MAEERAPLGPTIRIRDIPIGSPIILDAWKQSASLSIIYLDRGPMDMRNDAWRGRRRATLGRYTPLIDIVYSRSG